MINKNLHKNNANNWKTIQLCNEMIKYLCVKVFILWYKLTKTHGMIIDYIKCNAKMICLEQKSFNLNIKLKMMFKIRLGNMRTFISPKMMRSHLVSRDEHTPHFLHSDAWLQQFVFNHRNAVSLNRDMCYKMAFLSLSSNSFVMHFEFLESLLVARSFKRH